MVEYAIIGAGATASATARKLVATGGTVRMISRSGTGPESPGIERIALDANHIDELAEAIAGVSTVFNTAMTAYHTWPEAMPPLFDAILAATERSGADYVMMGNFYGYGPVSGPVTERTPLNARTRKGKVRAELWRRAEAAHEAGRVRATEVRAGQLLGPGAFSAFSFAIPNLLAGELALVSGNPDAAHAFSYTEDVAEAMVAAAGSEAAWGRAWHAPVITTTVREVAGRYAELHGAPEPRLDQLTERDLSLLGQTAPIWNEFREMSYMGDRPFLVDDTETRETFGLKASPLETALAN